MIIAHLSDPHHGPQFVEKSYRLAVKEVSKLDPDVVVVSGDFTENGLLDEYREAARYLRGFADLPVIKIPGNHDYRSTGYLIYQELFGERQDLSLGNVLFTSVSTARPDRDEGEVGHRQNTWLEENLKKNKGRTSVIVMHHHLVQVPDTGNDRITIVDAGDVLKTVVAQDTNLVLCGHRHRPWQWRVGNTTIAHAGTMSSQRTRGFFANTYNIVDLNESTGEARVWLKIIGGKKVDMSRVVSGPPYIPKLAP